MTPSFPRIGVSGLAGAIQRARTAFLGSGVSDKSALPSMIDNQLLSVTETVNTGNSALRGPDDGWMPFRVRYQGFIPPARVNIVPEFVYSSHLALAPRFQANGNNRPIISGDPNGSYKFRTDTTFYFGSNHRVQFNRYVTSEPSRLWGCAFGYLACIQLSSGTATTAGITLTGSSSAATRASANIRINSKIPVFDTVAPAISATARITIRPGNSSFYITHDRMPIHEVWGGVYPGHAYKIYQSTSFNPSCLTGRPKSCVLTANRAI